MKAFTDIDQSRKLAEILPVESADMHYCFNFDLAMNNWWRTIPNVTKKDNHFELYPNDIPCWSLAALLEVMPKQLGRYVLTFYWCDDSWCCSYIDDGSEIKETSSANNLVDATVEMIVKLKEKDLL